MIFRTMRANTKTAKRQLLARPLAAALFAVLVAAGPALSASADSFDEQINALEQQSAGFQAQAGQLRQQENDLQAQLSALDVQSQAIEAQIAANELKQQQLNDQIQQTSNQIAQQKQALGQTLKAMYINSDVSPLEMVASSKNISDFIDKQEYRNKISDAIQQSLDKIKKLQAELTDQRTQVQHALADQKTMQANLADQETQKNQLIAETQGQEAAYQQLVTANNAKVSDLQAQQRAANARLFGGQAGSGPDCGGGYPAAYCQVPMDSVVDNWGMYNRECVSYTAWKVASTGRYVPYGLGNANMWPAGARAAGIPVDGNPKAGDVAIWDIGPYGHAMYVESVNGNGTISVSQYNADYYGHFSTATISSSGLHFIHF